STSPVPVDAKMVVVCQGCVEHGVLLAIRHAVKFAFVVVSETDVFHGSSPPGGSRTVSRPDAPFAHLGLASFRSVRPALHAYGEHSQVLVVVAHGKDGR